MSQSDLKPLPLGIQTFEVIIQDQFLYVDKTHLIFQMIKSKSRYFFSRPRRFGKSLLISTLNSIFRGKKELFTGLSIEKMDYHWDTLPVIRLDMSTVTSDSEDALNKGIAKRLCELAMDYEIDLNTDQPPSEIFRDLITFCHQKTKQKVVVLIDEYDSPLVNQLQNGALVQKLITVLREFYRVTKSMDEYLQFVFVTGVTNFAKANMFSGLNHLENITMDHEYHNICGYTQEELEHFFKSYIDRLCTTIDKNRSEVLVLIKNWYNGYAFTKNSNTLYNPFSVLSLFKRQDFQNYWYQTGTPAFLVRLIQDTAFPQPTEFEHLTAFQKDFDTLKIEKPTSIPLLFQAGYLTIKRCIDDMEGIYELGYPNHEVKQSFLHSLLSLCGTLFKT